MAWQRGEDLPKLSERYREKEKREEGHRAATGHLLMGTREEGPQGVDGSQGGVFTQCLVVAPGPWPRGGQGTPERTRAPEL